MILDTPLLVVWIEPSRPLRQPPQHIPGDESPQVPERCT